MKEMGGYIEFPHFTGELMHSGAIALNSARNCLAYLIETKNIKKIALPKFLCASVGNVCENYKVKIHYYSVNREFLPCNMNFEENEWLYLVNYYGQVDNRKIQEIKKEHTKLIVDNVQAYFQKALNNIDTIYTCRKYFGVSDGAFLYTDKRISRCLEQDSSSGRMIYLLGRFENSANEFYPLYIRNEENFDTLPLQKMSKLTKNLLRSIDYDKVRIIRERNFLFLENKFSNINKITLKFSDGPFVYPLYIPTGAEIRKKLQKKKIYIPTLWPDVFDICEESDLEFDMAKNILPLPCDQRYDLSNMEFMSDTILGLL